MTNPEAARCLLCKKARCSAACPVATDVPTLMKLYREGKIEEAGKMLFENNPFCAITSRVCDWKKNCYGHCVLNARKIPIPWCHIEEEISDAFLAGYSVQPGEPNYKSVAIVGAGPAGMTAAIRLREAGYAVAMFDEHDRMGGILRYGIPDFRLDKSIVDRYEAILLEAGVEFHGGCRIGRDTSVSELRSSYDAVFVATGANVPRKLCVPGEENSPSVIYAVDYLNDPASFTLGRKVIVIGGGNVTMDASRTAIRAGHEVYVYYRKTFENMPANMAEVEEALEEGVVFKTFEVPVEVRGNIAIMRNCENVTREDGSLATRTIPGSEHEVAFDTMIVAVSANADYSILADAKMSNGKWPDVNEQQETSIPGVFMAGDFILGPSTVADSVHSAKIAVDGIRTYLEK